MKAFLSERQKKREENPAYFLKAFPRFGFLLLFGILAQIIILLRVHVKIALIITELKSVSGSTKLALAIIL